MPVPLTVIVLAAGKGTRMQSERPKVLHPLAGRAMIEHVLTTAAALAPARAVVVLAPGMDEVAAAVDRGPLPAAIAYQEPQLGTGHALLVAREHLPRKGEVLVLYGDTPLVTADDAGAAARGAPRRRRRGRGARLSPARHHGLRPPRLRRPGPRRDRRGAPRR